MPKFPSNMEVSKTEVSQTFDIETEFGVDLSGEPRLRDEIGQAIIDRMVDRTTKDNKDFTGTPFQPYSKEYIKSDDFKDFNKSSSDINLEMTGKMLESIDFTDTNSVIKVEVGSKQLLKAYNHQKGDTVKQRAFFGLSKKDTKAIKDSFSSEIERVKSKKAPSAQSILDLLATEQLQSQTTEDAFADLFGASFPGLDLGEF